MIKQYRIQLIVAAVVYLLYLIVANIPASWVANAVHKAAPNVWLSSVSGTAWNGYARGAQLDVGGSQIPMGSFRWKLKPLSLFLLSPCVEFDSELAGRPFEGTLCQSITGAQSVSDLAIELPLEFVADMVKLPMSGQASLDIAKAKIKGNQVKALDARLSVSNVRIRPARNWMTLGSYGAVMTETDTGAVGAQIIDTDAVFGVQLNAEWTIGSEDVIANGTIATTASSPPDAVSAIQIVGEEKQPGVYTIQWP